MCGKKSAERPAVVSLATAMRSHADQLLLAQKNYTQFSDGSRTEATLDNLCYTISAMGVGGGGSAVYKPKPLGITAVKTKHPLPQSAPPPLSPFTIPHVAHKISVHRFHDSLQIRNRAGAECPKPASRRVAVLTFV